MIKGELKIEDVCSADHLTDIITIQIHVSVLSHCEFYIWCVTQELS